MSVDSQRRNHAPFYQRTDRGPILPNMPVQAEQTRVNRIHILKGLIKEKEQLGTSERRMAYFDKVVPAKSREFRDELPKLPDKNVSATDLQQNPTQKLVKRVPIMTNLSRMVLQRTH